MASTHLLYRFKNKLLFWLKIHLDKISECSFPVPSCIYFLFRFQLCGLHVNLAINFNFIKYLLKNNYIYDMASDRVTVRDRGTNPRFVNPDLTSGVRGPKSTSNLQHNIRPIEEEKVKLDSLIRYHHAQTPATRHLHTTINRTTKSVPARLNISSLRKPAVRSSIYHFLLQGSWKLYQVLILVSNRELLDWTF